MLCRTWRRAMLKCTQKTPVAQGRRTAILIVIVKHLLVFGCWNVNGPSTTPTSKARCARAVQLHSTVSGSMTRATKNLVSRHTSKLKVASDLPSSDSFLFCHFKFDAPNHKRKYAHQSHLSVSRDIFIHARRKVSQSVVEWVVSRKREGNHQSSNLL